MSCVWALSFTGSYAVSRHATPDATMAYMQRYWAENFVSGGTGPVDAVTSVLSLIAGFFVDPLGTHAPYRIVAMVEQPFPALAPFALAGLAPLAALIGSFALWRTGKRVAAVMFVGPFGLLLIASMLRAYPFGGRTSAFLIPGAIIVIANGIVWTWRASTSPMVRTIVAAATATILLPPLRDAAAIPYDREELRPVVQYVVQHRRDGDAVYVYYGALQPMEYYASFTGLSPANYIAGVVARDRPAAYRADVERLAGTPRLWVILSHDYSGPEGSEWALLLDELGRMGTRRECFQRVGAQACLYQFPRRVTASSR